MPHNEFAPFIYQTFLFGFPLIGVYFNFKGQVQKQENRMTVLETENKHMKEAIAQNARRLDDHAKQNQALVAMTEQLKHLTADVQELKDLIKEVK